MFREKSQANLVTLIISAAGQGVLAEKFVFLQSVRVTAVT